MEKKIRYPFVSLHIYLANILVVLLIFAHQNVNAQTTNSYAYTGSVQTFVVPAGVTSITVSIWGAGGGGSKTGGSGGSGALVQGTMSVTAGSTLYLVVGGGGSYNAVSNAYGGGGASGVALTGAGGGGYSGIFSSNTLSQANALAIAGAGGGGGYYGISTYGGGGGATSGSAAGNYNGTNTGGGGGSAASGGIGGASTTGTNVAGTAGSALTGGGGGVTTSYGGGGGGGGYYGGGGGYGTRSITYYSSGGGGGSSYLGSMTTTTNTAGTTSNTGAATQAPGSSVTGYVSGVGNGGSSSGVNGANGLILITYSVACTTPIAQPTALTFPTVTSTSINGSFTAATGSPSGYLVLQSTSSSLSASPVNGTSYAAGASLGGGTVVQASSATTFTVSTLTSNTKYYYFIFSYNSACTGQPYYLTTSPLTNNTTTCAGAPTIGTTTGVTSGGFTINWTAPTGGSAGTITYTVDVSLTTTFGTGNDISGYPVSGITGLSNTLTGLNSNTTYYYKVTATNGICATTSAYTSQKTSFALCTTPAAPTGFTAGTQTSTTLSGSFTAPTGGANSYLVLYNTTGTAPTRPTDGITYAVGNTSLGATVASSSSGTTFTVTGLTANTNYYFFIYSFNNTSCTGGPLYSFGSLTGNMITCAGAPTIGAASGITSNGFTINWTAPTEGSAGTITYTVDVSLTTTFGASDIAGYPVSGITGLSNTPTGLSSNTRYYYQVTATNGICATTSARTNTTTSYPPCTAPSAPTGLSLTPGVVNMAGSFTAPGTAPTGYLVIRTTSSTAPTTPVTGTTYTAGASALGGYIVSVGSTTSFADNGLSASTGYWYWVYSYNTTACTGGPTYSLTSLNGSAITSAICGGSYSVYALDLNGYIYPVNTSTAVLQTPLNASAVATGSNISNALGYNASNSLFYYFSIVNDGGGSTFVSYDGAGTYNYGLASPFANGSNNYAVLGTATADGLGFYIMDSKALLWYYNIGANTWTQVVTTKIQDNLNNNLTTYYSGNVSGDLVEDGYGTLWLLLTTGTNYGLFYVTSPPTTAQATLTVQKVIAYNTALPTKLTNATDHWCGAAFDNAGNLWMASDYYLYDIPLGSTTPNYIGQWSNFYGSGTNIYDLSQCTYTSNPLPITWTYFSASPQNNIVNLHWGIAQASSVKGFYVERSNDSKNWDTLAFVSYSSNNLQYSFIDQSPLSGNNYYRINETDYDDNDNYSDIRIVNFHSASEISIWPNPATDAIHIRCNSNANNMMASIFDELGRNVLNSALNQGDNLISLGNVGSGMYFVVIKENNVQIDAQKIMLKHQ